MKRESHEERSPSTDLLKLSQEAARRAEKMKILHRYFLSLWNDEQHAEQHVGAGEERCECNSCGRRYTAVPGTDCHAPAGFPGCTGQLAAKPRDIPEGAFSLQRERDPEPVSIHDAPGTRSFGCPTADLLFGLGADHCAELTVTAEAIRDQPDWLDSLIADLQGLRKHLGDWRPREDVSESEIVDQLRELTR